MIELLNSLQGLLYAVWNVIAAIGQLAASNGFLLAWISYFTFAVSWAKAFEVFSKGGWVAASLVCLAVMAMMAMIRQTGSEQTSVFGWDLYPVAGTITVVMTYLAIAFVCGSIQMQGLPAKVLNWFQRHTQNIA